MEKIKSHWQVRYGYSLVKKAEKSQNSKPVMVKPTTDTEDLKNFQYNEAEPLGKYDESHSKKKQQKESVLQAQVLILHPCQMSSSFSSSSSFQGKSP